MFRFDQRPLSFARVVLLALLALGVACAPVLASAAGTHDLVEHAGDHDTAGGNAHDHADEAAGQGDGGQVLHVVMLLGGCCGHASAALPCLPSLALVRAADRPDARVDALPPDAGTDRLLRPPIAA